MKKSWEENELDAAIRYAEAHLDEFEDEAP